MHLSPFENRIHSRSLLALICLAAWLGISAPLFAQESICGSLRNHFGPFDYRIASAGDKKMVEGRHFTTKVETLRVGMTSITPGGDLSDTLGVFPNHPRALMAMMKLAEREKTTRPRDSAHTIACWLDRAERFRPDDAGVKMVYGVYLSRQGKKQDAIRKLDELLELGVPSPNVDYNVGLVYFNLGEYDKSLKSAHRAYAAGFNLPGLKQKLVRAGKWQEPAKARPAAGK